MADKPTKRHLLSIRIWHWVNAVSLIVLFMSGLGISNAHRYLYWGDYGFDPADAWLAVMRFPSWTTIPSHYNLAESRDWHILMAWPFALALLFIWIAMLLNRHFWRDIKTSSREWKPSSIAADFRAHMRLLFSRGEAESAAKYNFLQKLAYGLVYGVFLPMMVFTGLAISPGFEPAAPWLVDLLGGRQSARSLHFIFAFATFGFVFVHIIMVLLSGSVKQTWGMIAGGKRESQDEA